MRDIVIGMADGLTVPFALAAGLTGAIASSHIVIPMLCSGLQTALIGGLAAAFGIARLIS